MTEQEKQLLIKDLCARLAYGVKVERNGDVCKVLGIIDDNIILTANVPTNQQTKIVNIKPYLHPMSSMTEEEKNEFIHYAGYEVEESVNGRHYEYYLKDFVGTPEKPSCNCDAIDWLNARHFDYRGLIEKGLALEAPEDMY